MHNFLQTYGQEIVTKTGEHLFISGLALFLGILIAVPLGILLTRFKKVANLVVSVVSVLQTVPSLALLAMMIPLFGVGKLSAVIALFIYSLLPILRNTYLGLENVDPNSKDAAKGMGMTAVQSIVLVEMPLAMPTIMAGIRLAGVYVISWATLASYIGAGGLGDLIFSGLNLYKPELIIGGTIPVTLLAVLADWLLGRLEYKLTPQSLRGSQS